MCGMNLGAQGSVLQELWDLQLSMFPFNILLLYFRCIADVHEHLSL